MFNRSAWGLLRSLLLAFLIVSPLTAGGAGLVPVTCSVALAAPSMAAERDQAAPRPSCYGGRAVVQFGWTLVDYGVATMKYVIGLFLVILGFLFLMLGYVLSVLDLLLCWR